MEKYVRNKKEPRQANKTDKAVKKPHSENLSRNEVSHAGFHSSKSKIKVSVVIAVYNGEKYLAQCLDSVISQTLREIEIICVNDGSTDSSGKILESYAVKDERVKIISIPNGGAGAARNTGMRQAQGKYLSFLDADDFFEKDMLKKTYEAAEKHSAEIAVFRCDFYDQQTQQFHNADWTIKTQYLPSNNPFSCKDIPDYILNFTYGWAWDKLFLTEFVRKNSIRFLEQNIFEDTHFTCIACALAKRIYFIDEILAHYRTNTNASLSSSKGKYVDDVPKPFRLIRKRLIEAGLFESVKRGFVNRICAALFDVFLNTEGEPRARLYDHIRNEYLNEFELTGHPEEYFYQSHLALFVQEVAEYEYVDYLSVRLVRVEKNYKKAVAEKRDAENRLNCIAIQESNVQNNIRNNLLAQRAGGIILKPYFVFRKLVQFFKNNGFKKTCARIFKGRKIYFGKEVNVCFVTDEGFCMPSAVTITSILKNRAKSYVYNIYVLGYQLSEDSKRKLESIRADNFYVRVIDASNSEIIKRYRFTSKTVHVTPAALLKFFIPQYLDFLDKVLYLDGDMVVQTDLLELYNIDIRGRYAAVVKDIVSTFAWHKKEVSYSSPYYFNSGMMLLNLSEMRKDAISSRLIDYRIGGKNFYMDQDALNVVFGGNVRFISPCFNFMNKLMDEKGAMWLSAFYNEYISENFRKSYKKAHVIHFASSKKPWYNRLPYLTELFLKYYKLSPYGDRKIYPETPKEYEELKKANNFNEYLKNLWRWKDEVVLMMAIKDDGSVYWDKIKFPSFIRKSGKKPSFRNGYVYIKDFSEDCVLEQIGKTYAEQLYEGQEVKCLIKSQVRMQGEKPGFEMVITPQGWPNIKISKNGHRGLNVAVYSKKCRRVVDSFSVDTFADKNLKIDRS